MKCEEYREAITANPDFVDAEQHAARCEACEQYAIEMQALDRQIRRALAIEVPALAVPRLDDAGENVLSLTPRRRRLRPAWLAVAATVTLAAFAGLWIAANSVREFDSLADEVLAHVHHERDALRVTNEKVADRRLYDVVPAHVAVLDHSAGLITYAETCPINGQDVPHLVLQGDTGPITILLMPNENVAEPISLQDERSHGVILPVGDGSIAIVGPRDANLSEVQEHVLQSVLWAT